MLSLILIVVLSYLVGSIPSSVWLGKLAGIDIREHGSGNAGATNTFRVLGWKSGVMALLIDIGKGMFASGIISRLRVDALPFEEGVSTSILIMLVAAASAVLGHVFPILAGFKGGKGVGTAAGSLIVITPVGIGLAIAIFLAVLLLTRYVSLASILAAISLPITLAVRRFYFGNESVPIALLVFGLVIGIGIVFLHRSNIQRLMAGTENRVTSFKPGAGSLQKEGGLTDG